jgi:hypothetical protein
MKADGGALLYIVIAVVSLIISAIGKNKKREMPPVSSEHSSDETEAPRQAPQPTWQKELEDIFGKVLDEPEVAEKHQYEVPKPAEMPKHKNANQQVDPTIAALNKYAESKQASREDKKADNNSHVMAPIEEEHETTVFNPEEFELSKAVIYSEVLNRKYF